jgi:ATP-dependent DNA helicase DinG
MLFEVFATTAGLVARPYQRDLADAVAGHLASGAPVAVAVQATTGVGKTWALAFAAVEAVRRGQRVIWSTHTILLRMQVLATLAQAGVAAELQRTDGFTLAERRGRADYPSASRSLRLRHALQDRGAERERIAQLDALAGWPGTIAEFVAAAGELLVPQSLVCLTASCPTIEQVAYVAQRDAAAGARIVVQTHALTLIEARFRRLNADLVIFDEADALPGVAAGAVETRLALDDLAALAAQADADIGQPLVELRERADAGPAILWRDADMAAASLEIAGRLKAASASTGPELAEVLADTAAELVQFANVEQPKTGAALVTDAAAGPVLAVAAVDAAGWLGTALAGRQTVLMSATLGRHEDADLAAACRQLGFWDVRQVSVSPAQFGSMEFRLADRRAPLPFAPGGIPAPAFCAYAAAVVREAARAGRTLVLCASYGDAEELGQRLGPDTIVQRRGQPLKPLVDRFRAAERSVLVTPSAWAGLDLPHVVDNVVIVRLPVSRPDTLRQAVLTEALVRRGRSADDARSILAVEGRADVMRRLAQGMGRGVRAEDDRCTVWIADPRFPLPANMVVDLRRGLGQGAASPWLEMANAIPLRFRQPTGRSAFDRARIVPWVADGADGAHPVPAAAN